MELGFVGVASSTKKEKNRNNSTNNDSQGNIMVYDTETLTTGFNELNDGGNENHNDLLNATASTPATKRKRISEFDAIQHLIKGNLGPGCLNIPHAFALSGWVLGLFLFALVALQGIYSMVLLIYCKRWIRQDQKRQRIQGSADNNNVDGAGDDTHDAKEIVTFMDVAYSTHGRAGSICVQILLFVLQAGVCCVFLSLIATNLHASVPSWDQEWCVCLVTLLLLAVVLVKDLKDLKWLSMGANCLMVTAILTAAISALWVLFAKIHGDNQDGDMPTEARKWTSNPAAIAAFVSSMYYSFEGIGLVMPVENSFVGYDDGKDENQTSSSGNRESPLSLANDEDDDGEELNRDSRSKTFVSPVLIGAMCTVALLFLLIGSTCGPAFPDIVEGSVTAYLTTKYPNSRWYQVVNASVMVAVFLTFPLQLTPAMEVLGEWFGPGCDPMCCNGISCGGGGFLLVRQRVGQRRGHTPIAQSDENDRGEDDFHEEDEAAAAAVEPNDGLMADRVVSPLRNSCFGNHEWIFRRYLVVFGCALVVLTINDLGLLMSLFGALGNTGLAAMPCLIHWRLMQKGIAPMDFLLMAVDVSTIGMSLGVAVVGVAFSVREILER